MTATTALGLTPTQAAIIATIDRRGRFVGNGHQYRALRRLWAAHVIDVDWDEDNRVNGRPQILVASRGRRFAQAADEARARQ